MIEVSRIFRIQAATYILNNFKPACPMDNSIEFATSQLDVNFTGSHQVGIRLQYR